MTFSFFVTIFAKIMVMAEEIKDSVSAYVHPRYSAMLDKIKEEKGISKSFVIEAGIELWVSENYPEYLK